MLKKAVIMTLFAMVLSSAGWIKHARIPAQAGSDDSFIVGVFRPDGAIIPFARYANRTWTNPWHSPQPDAQPDEPDTIADLPKPWYESFVKPSAEWYLSLLSAGASTVRTSQNIQVCSHCQQVWGLLTDYPKAKPPEKNACVSNLGIALSEKKQTSSIEELTTASPDWKALMTFLGAKFEQSEEAGVEDELTRQYAGQLPSAPERAKVRLSMLHLYRSQHSEEGPVVFYFEAGKEYPKPRDANDAGCDNLSLFTGWVVAERGNLALLDSHYQLTDCDMKEGGLTVPFAVLHLDGKKFVVVEEIGYEGESYAILEIRKGSVRRVLETYAGSC
jgi:hypothetical protein